MCAGAVQQQFALQAPGLSALLSPERLTRQYEQIWRGIIPKGAMQAGQEGWTAYEVGVFTWITKAAPAASAVCFQRKYKKNTDITRYTHNREIKGENCTLR